MRNQREAWTFAAVAGISAVVIAGFGWLEVLLGWCVCGLLRLTLRKSRREPGKAAAVFLLLGGVLVASMAVFAAEEAFPEDSTFPFVSLGVMALLFRALIGGKNAGKNVGNVLGLILLPLLGAVVLFGLSDVRWSENIPVGMVWEQVWITVAVTSPWWVFTGEEKSWSWFVLCGAISVGMCLMTRGILGAALTEQSTQPLYRAVQTIHIFGVLQRFEALLAAAVLLGAFGMMLFAGKLMRDGMELLTEGRWKRWHFGVAVVAAFCMEIVFRYWLGPWKDMVIATFWGIVPVFALWVVLFGNKAEN